MSPLVIVDRNKNPVLDWISFLDSKDIGSERIFFFSGLDIMSKSFSIGNIIQLISHKKCKRMKEKQESKSGGGKNGYDSFFGV